MPRRRLCTGGRRPGAFRSLGARALEKDDALMIVKIISASCTVAVKVPAQALGLRPWLAALPLRERRLRARLLMGVTPSVVRVARDCGAPGPSLIVAQRHRSAVPVSAGGHNSGQKCHN
jgi:hypothetical protein